MQAITSLRFQAKKQPPSKNQGLVPQVRTRKPPQQQGPLPKEAEDIVKKIAKQFDAPIEQVIARFWYYYNLDLMQYALKNGQITPEALKDFESLLTSEFDPNGLEVQVSREIRGKRVQH